MHPSFPLPVRDTVTNTRTSRQRAVLLLAWLCPRCGTGYVAQDHAVGHGAVAAAAVLWGRLWVLRTMGWTHSRDHSPEPTLASWPEREGILALPPMLDK